MDGFVEASLEGILDLVLRDEVTDLDVKKVEFAQNPRFGRAKFFEPKRC